MQATTDTQEHTSSEPVSQVNYQDYFACSPSAVTQGDDDADGDE